MLLERASFAFDLPSLGIATLLAVVSAALVTWLARRKLIEYGIMDVPNERSNHKAPVARGSGIALVMVALLFLTLLGWPIEVVIITSTLSILCFVDDMRGLPRRVRFWSQIAAVAAGIWLTAAPFYAMDFYIPVLIFLAISWLWFINLFNFMDGIDGITGMQTIAMSLGMALIGLQTPTMPLWFVPSMVLLAAVALGYLWLNWHPAKVFLGDAGSIPLGFLLGFGLVTLAFHGQYVAALLVAGYYGGDATLTIVKRLARREKIWRAHSEHGYQLAVRERGYSHPKVVLIIALLNVLLIALAQLSLRGGLYAWGAFGAGAILVLFTYLWFSSFRLKK